MQRTLLALLIGVIATACGGGGDSPPPTTAPPTTTASIALSLGSASVSALQGGSATVTVTVTRTGSVSGDVSLAAEGLPAGVTATFAPPALNASTTASTLSLAVGTSAAVGTATVTVRASASGVTAQTATISLTVTAAPTPDFTLAVTPAALSVVAGQAGQASVAITRTGGQAGGVTFALEGAPAGVSGTFTPNPASGATAALAVSVAAGVAPGNYPLTIRGTSGTLVRTSALTLTVTAPAGVTVAVAPTALSIAQGASGQASVTLTRLGGLGGDIALTASGAPAGMSVAFNPQSVAGASSVVTVTVGASVAAGQYPVVLTATGNGGVTASATLTVTVTASGGGGGGDTIVWRFCKAGRVPLWFAYRDGASGSWTRVTVGANNTFTFTIAQSVGGVAYTTREVASQPTTEVYFLTRAELQAQASAECSTTPAIGKTVNGTVAGLGTGEQATIYHGGGTGIAFAAAPNFSVTNVQDGPQDLLAVRRAAGVTNRFFLQRNVNVAAGGALPLVDFAGASSFAPVTANVTVANAGSDEVFANAIFRSANGTQASYGLLSASGTTVPFFGIPDASLGAGELHAALVSASDATGTTSRGMYAFFRTVSARTLTLGPAAGAATLTSTTAGGLARPKASGALQGEYGDIVLATFSQTTGSILPSVLLTASRGFLGTGATQYALETPDLAAIAGFDPSWGLLPGRSTTFGLIVTGTLSGTLGAPADGTTWRFASRQQLFTP